MAAAYWAVVHILAYRLGRCSLRIGIGIGINNPAYGTEATKPIDNLMWWASCVLVGRLHLQTLLGIRIVCP